MITILLAGQARVGKTTAANLIASHAKKQELKPVILPFADAIKKEAESMGYAKDKDPVAYRAFCQNIGMSKRKENPDHWINLFKKRWIELEEKDKKNAQDLDKLWKETVVIVDDCRYLNELNLGKSIGAKCVFISRGKRVLEDQDAEWRKHESEEMANEFEAGNKDYMDLFDFVIRNEDGKDAYCKKLMDRMDLFLDATPFAYVNCDCFGCQKARRDDPMDLEDFFREFFL